MKYSFNPTISALWVSYITNKELSSPKVAHAAAMRAINATPPASDDLYEEEKFRIDRAKGLPIPYFKSETKFAAFVGLLGIAITVASPLILGLTGLSIILMVIGALMLIHGWDGTFHKDVPSEITDQTLDEANAQLEESGEANRKPVGMIGTLVILGMCSLEGWLNADSVVGILGESRMSPSTVKMISIGLTAIIAYFLWKSMNSAAKEKRENHARRTIRHNEITDPPRAAAMKARLGTALDNKYAPMDEKTAKQWQFWILFASITVLSLGLRIGALLMSPPADSTSTSPASEHMTIPTTDTKKGQ